MTVFRKVSVKEREPEVGLYVIAGWDERPNETCSVYLAENGIWWLANFGTDCDEPDWWLEEVPVPSIDEINAEADRQFPEEPGNVLEAGKWEGFKRGGEWMYNRILRKLT